MLDGPLRARFHGRLTTFTLPAGTLTVCSVAAPCVIVTVAGLPEVFDTATAKLNLAALTWFAVTVGK